MNYRKQYAWWWLFTALFVVVAVEKKQPTPDCCGNVLESRGIGAGSSPIGCEGLMKAKAALYYTFKCQ